MNYLWEISMSLGNILIIDDEVTNNESLQGMLEDVSYSVSCALDTNEARSLIKDNEFDLIMMDVWMPGQDGISFLEELKAKGLTTPIIMMSGHAQHNDIIRSMKLGAIDFLKKPPIDLLSIVREAMADKIEKNDNFDTNDFNLPIKEARNNFERRYFNYHLENNQHNIARVAEKAGLERTTLYRKLKDLGIDKS